MATSTSTVSLKLLIDTKREKVLFAEAGKDFVDFLFTLLSLPVGSVIRVLSKEGMVGCLGKLYGSVESLNNTYMQPCFSKDSLLKPRATTTTLGGGADVLRMLTNTQSWSPPVFKAFYYCKRCSPIVVSDDSKAVCPYCRHNVDTLAIYVPRPPVSTGESASWGEGGYVKDVVTYMIMDDLEVAPMSTISSMTVLKKFNVKDVDALEEKVVQLGMPEGVKLLRESLRSNLVLTNVFLKAGD